MGYCDKALQPPPKSSQRVSRLHAWLSPSDIPRSADLIFVVAGRMSRKEYGLELLRQGFAPRILISVGRFEIRRFSKMALPAPLDLLKLAQKVPPPQRHYFVFSCDQLVEAEHVPPGRFGTLTEIAALSRWLNQNPDIRSVLIVSSDTHLRRIRLCCRALVSSRIELAFLAAPSSEETTEDAKHFNFTPKKEELLETFKLAIYWGLLKTRWYRNHA
jgi:uncharacterized SAM-binding protein YcdF (DUF218 family)